MCIDSESIQVKLVAVPKVRQAGRLLLSIGFIFLGALFGCGGSGPATGSISGSITVPGSQSGTIYVLAIPAENAGKLRVAETEARPHRSAWVARYTQLSGPGSYTLDGLLPGNYVVWGWVDVNGDGGVNHMNYAEPAGWYQTRTSLYLCPVTVEASRNATAIDLRLIAPTPYPAGEKAVARGQGGGKLKTIKGQKVLQLWGTPQERAYAHGYLVGPQIMDFFNYAVVEYFAKSVDLYQEVLQYVQGHFAGNAPYASEADAMLQGMKESGTNMMVATLGRELTRDDLIVQNNLAILRYWVLHAKPYWPLDAKSAAADGELDTPFCTSAVFWGDWTQNRELSGALIHGKNNDGENDLRKVTVNSTLIIATTPPAGSGKKRTIGIDWPGYYGTYHGMNEDGLVLQAQGAFSVSNWDAADLLDYTLFYREALQATGTIDGVVNLWGALPATRAVGFNTPISTPYRPGQAGYPSSTYETDSYGGALRTPVDFAPADPYSILTTNNYYKYQGTDPYKLAVSKIHGYHASVEERDYRFRDMLSLIA
ncbi:MAG: C45 family peptidase, partial [Syntrophales bacterium]